MEKAKLPLYYIADELEEMQKKEQQTGNEKDQKDDNKPKVEPIILDSQAIEEETPKDGKSVQTTGVFLIGIAIILAVFEFFFELFLFFRRKILHKAGNIFLFSMILSSFMLQFLVDGFAFFNCFSTLVDEGVRNFSCLFDHNSCSTYTCKENVFDSVFNIHDIYLHDICHLSALSIAFLEKKFTCHVYKL